MIIPIKCNQCSAYERIPIEDYDHNNMPCYACAAETVGQRYWYSNIRGHFMEDITVIHALSSHRIANALETLVEMVKTERAGK